jgi:hypothetical protein
MLKFDAKERIKLEIAGVLQRYSYHMDKGEPDEPCTIADAIEILDELKLDIINSSEQQKLINIPIDIT